MSDKRKLLWGVQPTPQQPRGAQGICNGHQCALEHRLRRDDQWVPKEIDSLFQPSTSLVILNSSAQG